MPSDNDPRSTEELKAVAFGMMKEYVEYLANDCGDHPISMTAATESIFGTSGRGSSRAVRIIETLSRYGFVTITGNKKRRVVVSKRGHELLNS